LLGWKSLNPTSSAGGRVKSLFVQDMFMSPEENLPESMFYHIKVNQIGIVSCLIKQNLTRADALHKYVCPFLNKEVVLLDDRILNMSAIGGIRVYETKEKIDLNWPIKKDELKVGEFEDIDFKYDMALEKKLVEVAKDVTSEMYKEATELFIKSGK
jgi:hypothetical protein